MGPVLRWALLAGLLLGAAACGPLRPATDPPPYYRGAGGNGSA